VVPCPQRGSNPCYRLERAASWTARRWGLVFAGGEANDTCTRAGAGHHPGNAVSRDCRGTSEDDVPRVADRFPGGPAGTLCAVNLRRTASLPAVVLTAAVLLAGCGAADGAADGGTAAVTSASGPASASTSAPASASDSPSATGGTARPDDGRSDAPPFPATTDPETSDASPDAQVTVRDIRTGRHDGFDRVVLEVGGTGTPGWDVRYVDQATSQGSGDPVQVAGSAVLQVSVTGAGIPDATGVPEFAGPDPLRGEGTKTVTEVVFDATFEGTTVAFVGTSARVPFRVYALQNPSRVVVEVRDASS
jgi:hypothetical protein